MLIKKKETQIFLYQIQYEFYKNEKTRLKIRNKS